MWGGHPGMSNSCHAGLMVRQLGGSGLAIWLGRRSSGNLGRVRLARHLRHTPCCCACLDCSALAPFWQGPSNLLACKAEVVACAATSLPVLASALTGCGLCRDKHDMCTVQPTPTTVICEGDQAAYSCAVSSCSAKLTVEWLAVLRSGIALRHVVGGLAMSGTLCEGHGFHLLHWVWLEPS